MELGKNMDEVLKKNEEIIKKNKEIIIKALSNAGIAKVVICYDGAGDSGMFEDAQFFDDEKQVTLSKDVDVVLTEVPPYWITKADSETEKPKTYTQTLPKAVTDLAYDFVSNLNPGWEISEGSFGDIAIDVKENKMLMVHNMRYTQFHTSEISL